MKKKYIYITSELEAFHKWKQAPEEVKFLRNLQRHRFIIKVGLQIGKEREVEFFMVKWRLNTFLKNYSRKIVGSCERIAESILEWCRKNYGKERNYFIEVSEDGENGVILTTDNKT